MSDMVEIASADICQDGGIAGDINAHGRQELAGVATGGPGGGRVKRHGCVMVPPDYLCAGSFLIETVSKSETELCIPFGLAEMVRKER